MILVNSDDFGASKEINLATYRAFSQNLISSTTALVNFSEGLEDAISYVKSNKIDSDAIGIHLNLSYGRPLTERMRSNAALCENGIFKSKNNLPNFFIGTDEKECILEELDAQISLFIERFGFLPSHIDSHQHVHTKWPILQCVIRLAVKHGIGSVRLSRNIEASRSFKKVIYKRFVNNFLRYKGLASVDKFGDIDQAIKYGVDPKKNYELMVHVNLAKDNLNILDIDGRLLEPKLTTLYKNDNWLLVNYWIMRNAFNIASTKVEFEIVGY